MSTVIKVAAGLAAVLVILLAIDWFVDPGTSQVESALTAVRDVVTESLTGAPVDETAPAEEDDASPEPAAPVVAAATRDAPSPAVDPVEAPTDTPAPVPAEPSIVPVENRAEVPVASLPAPARHAYFLPGRTSWWTTYQAEFTTPIVVRAAGQIEAGALTSGPDGLRRVDGQAANGQPMADARAVLPSAPLLALIGRVCSEHECTDPFFVGAESVLCPSRFGVDGRLQLWTNNHVAAEGGRTALDFAVRTGGYSFYVEPATDEACGTVATGRAGLATSNDARVLAAGGVLSHPEFEISSSQTAWKPFFVPLETPIRITASGSMRPAAGALSTGPAGMDVPPGVSSWHYPGEPTVSIGEARRLFDRSLPYQALIGRLCGVEGCGAPFLVGSETVVCPTPAQNVRIELWINHIVAGGGLLARQTSLTFDTFDMQRRQGSYRFEVSAASSAECRP